MKFFFFLIFGPLFFNAFSFDIFFIMKETNENLADVINSLQENSTKLFQWFSVNQIKANHNQCRLLLSGKNYVTMNVSGILSQQGLKKR